MATRYRNPEFYPHKKRLSLKWLIPVFLVVLTAGYVYLALNRDIPTGSVLLHDNVVAQPDIPQIIWPSEGYAAIGTLDEGVLARSHENEQPRPIASLTKVITALAILEKEPLQPGQSGITITFDKQDEDSYWEYVAKDGTVTAVTAGESISQYQALQAMLLPSSNNMSDTMVRNVFGSMDSYTEYANDMLRRYGLENTRVADASGFSPQSVSTPSELIIIGQKALEHPVIAEIVAQDEADIPIAGTVPNYNQLLKLDDVTGIKPGATDEAGMCLLFSARYTDDAGQQVTIIGVVLGVQTIGQIYNQSAQLLRSTQAGLRQVELVRGGQVVGNYNTPWGEQADLIAQESIWTYNVQANLVDPNFQTLDIPPAPVANQTVALLDIGSVTASNIPVQTDGTVHPPSLFWRLTHPLASAINYFR